MERTRRPCVWRAALLSMKSCKRSLDNYEDIFLQGYITQEILWSLQMCLSWRPALGLANVCICNKTLVTLQKKWELLGRWSIVCIINYGFRQSSYRRWWRQPRFLQIMDCFWLNLTSFHSRFYTHLSLTKMHIFTILGS